VDVLDVDNRVVVDAASNGCAFFNWCLVQQPEPSHAILRGKLRDELKLRAYMWAGQRKNKSRGQYISIRWETGPASESVAEGQAFCIKGLYIMAEVGKYCNILVSVMATEVGLQEILQRVITRHAPSIEVWHLPQTLTLLELGLMSVVRNILPARVLIKT
jgi:hypothetical protein